MRFNISLLELERAVEYAKTSPDGVITFHVIPEDIGTGFKVSMEWNSETLNITDISRW